MNLKLILTLALIAPLPAIAGDINESPIKGKGAISAVHNEPAAKIHGHSTEEINSALASLGRPQLGTSRILQDDGNGGTPEIIGIATTKSWSRTPR